MGKTLRTKGIKNRGSQIHEDKYRQYKKDGILPHIKWLNSLNEEEHDDVPRRNPCNAIHINSNRDALDST